MGQYYIPCLLEKNYKTSQTPVKCALDAYLIDNNGMKLTEHSYVGNGLVNTSTYMLLGNKTHPFVWCGDYADGINDEKNMYQFARKNDFVVKCTQKFIKENGKLINNDLKYVINHTKKQFIIVEDNNDNELKFHPLPLLTADGNGRGSGDFWGTSQDMIGRWAYDIIECNDDAPEGYEEIFIEFKEDTF